MADLTLQQVAIRYQLTEDQVRDVIDSDKTFYSQWTTEIEGCLYFTQRAAARVARDHKLLTEKQEKEQKKELEKQEKMEWEKKGARLKEARQAVKLSVEKASQQADLNPNLFRRIESGKCAIAGEVERALCAALHINQKWLETGEGEMLMETSTEELASSEHPTEFMPQPAEVEAEPVKQESEVNQVKVPVKKRESVKRKSRPRVTKACFDASANPDVKGIRDFYIQNNILPVLEIASSSDEDLTAKFTKEYILLEHDHTTYAVRKDAWFGILGDVYKVSEEDV